MTAAELAAVGLAAVVAAAVWVYLFRLDSAGLWTRTPIAAAALIAYSVAANALLGDLSRLVGPISASELGIGLGVGVAWVVATHIGAAALERLAPSFVEQTGDLYDFGSDGQSVAGMALPLLLMAVGEELLFRGVAQRLGGLAVGVAIYTVVQTIEGKWPLIAAAALSGAVWGALFAWRDGLVAPIVAHAVWTLTVALVWPVARQQSLAVS